MIPLEDVKGTTRFLSEFHAQNGAGAVFLNTGELCRDEIDLGTPYEFPGTGVTPTELRRILFEASAEDKADPRAVLWTAYEVDEDMTYAGLGKLKEPT